MNQFNDLKLFAIIKIYFTNFLTKIKVYLRFFFFFEEYFKELLILYIPFSIESAQQQFLKICINSKVFHKYLNCLSIQK